MTKVYTGASMSLNGYISGPAETGFEHLFKWYGNGDVEVPTAQPERTLRMSAVSADHFRNIIDNTGALVVGRKLFDATGGWGGNHPMGRPVVVLTHSVPQGWPREDAPFSFVTDGIEAAIDKAKALAGTRWSGSTAAPSPPSASTRACWTRSGSISSRSCWAAGPPSSTS
jgi:dihydrofolate reductase